MVVTDNYCLLKCDTMSGTISELDCYLIFHTTHIPKESSLQFIICLKITRMCVIHTH